LTALLKLLRRRGITPVVFAERPDHRELFDASLELSPGGKWRWNPKPAAKAQTAK
jgi:hypothetical protein